MTDLQKPGISPPYEAFYIEAMLYCTTAVLNAENEINAALEFAAAHSPESEEWQQVSRVVIDGVQEIVLNSAALSRYFWPAGHADLQRSRAAHLRDSLGVHDDSPMKNRHLRNQLEHLDEELDRFCAVFRAGIVLPTWIGPLSPELEVPANLFRAYYTDVGVFEVLGKRYEIVPILEAVRSLHGKLLRAGDEGGRLPRRQTSAK